MSLTYIKFGERKDEARGLASLADHSRVDAFRGGVYCVREQDLVLLDSAGLSYRPANEDEIHQATAGTAIYQRATAR